MLPLVVGRPPLMARIVEVVISGVFVTQRAKFPVFSFWQLQVCWGVGSAWRSASVQPIPKTFMFPRREMVRQFIVMYLTFAYRTPPLAKSLFNDAISFSTAAEVVIDWIQIRQGLELHPCWLPRWWWWRGW